MSKRDKKTDDARDPLEAELGDTGPAPAPPTEAVASVTAAAFAAANVAQLPTDLKEAIERGNAFAASVSPASDLERLELPPAMSDAVHLEAPELEPFDIEPAMAPKIGRPVVYLMQDGLQIPGVICAVNEDGSCNLRLFPDGNGVPRAVGIHRGNDVGEWDYPL